MSDRRAAAAATLAALGIDAEALAEGRLAADALLSHATGDDAGRVLAAIGELGTAGAAAALVALEPRVAGGTRRERVRREPSLGQRIGVDAERGEGGDRGGAPIAHEGAPPALGCPATRRIT